METEPLDLELPDSSIIEWELRIVSYIDSNGEGQLKYRKTPDVQTSSMIGALQMTLHDLAHEANPWEED